MRQFSICLILLSLVVMTALLPAQAGSGAVPAEGRRTATGRDAQAQRGWTDPAEYLRLYRLDRIEHTQSLDGPAISPAELQARAEEEYARVADERTRNEFEPIEVPGEAQKSAEDEAAFPMEAHTSFSELAARYWGLSAARIQNIKLAGDQPDVYQAGITAAYNQQWSHAFILSSGNVWVWGDADDDFYDNLNGDSGEWESPEGLYELSAKDYYGWGDQYWGDWYLGYATHYIEDVNLVVHTSAPYQADLLTKHFAFEDWIKNNLTAGHRLITAAASDPYYYAVTDPKATIRNGAYFSCYWSNDHGRRVWDAYKASGYPTAAGTGNADLVRYAKEMMIRTIRYTRGTVKYALDRYGQWTSRY